MCACDKSVVHLCQNRVVATLAWCHWIQEEGDDSAGAEQLVDKKKDAQPKKVDGSLAIPLQRGGC